MNDNIIILTDGENYEAWGGLTEICDVYGFDRNYLKTKFKGDKSKGQHFKYKGLDFFRVPFRTKLKVEIPRKKPKLVSDD